MRLRLSLRFILPLLIALTGVALLLAPVADRLTFQWFVRDIDARAALISNAMRDSLLRFLKKPSGPDFVRLAGPVIQDERLFGIAICDPQGKMIARTDEFPPAVHCLPGLLPGSRVERAGGGALHSSYHPVIEDGKVLGNLVLVHDLSFAEKRSAQTQLYMIYLMVGLGVIVSVITVVVAQLSWKGWIEGLRGVLKGEGLFRPMSQIPEPEMRPIVRDMRELVRDLENARRNRDESQVAWSPQALRDVLQHDLTGDEVIVVSNREPYIHFRRGGKIEAKFPASGLVTAMEPIMRACSGTWVAHGSGDADRETVDENDRVAVPPGAPAYQLRRVWLSKEEEQGYYYGFANEGLWSLCHIAHVRPIFRKKDWQTYVAVNEKFAKAVVEEAKTDDPIVLVQDYHLALAPAMIRKRLPKATVITFWHIPFPNPEVFGVCPWRKELLEGLLGSSILGFHTPFHCNNFVATVDRVLEARIDRDTSTISHQGRPTVVAAYPISIEFPVKWMEGISPVDDCRRRIREMNDLPPEIRLGIGVDRLDYTKGILERFLAVETFLEREPDWIGKFAFVQIAAPSRSGIEQYQKFEAEVRAAAVRINRRFGRDGYEPILLKIEHHEPRQVYEYYRASDLCFVSSLHDGMNLVAKEFIAARDDDAGVLILSQFTGAARELPEALIVNPYDIDQCASAISVALKMPAGEQRDRMRSMRALVQEFNVYRWAGRMLLDAARLRQRMRLLGSWQGNGRDRFSIELSI